MLAERHERVQIEEHEAATGHKCYALLSIPGAATRVNAFKLVAVTGDRFLNAFHGAASTDDCVMSKRPRSANPDATPSRGAERATSSSDAETAAVNALVDILEGRAPARLSPQQVLDLADVAQLFMADAILEALPAYIRPLFSADGCVALEEVRCGA